MTFVGAFFVRLETGDERMSEYKKYFEAYCKEHDLELRLSSEMPVGYETANGTFDVSSRTVFINAEKLNKEPEYSKLFYLNDVLISKYNSAALPVMGKRRCSFRIIC